MEIIVMNNKINQTKNYFMMLAVMVVAIASFGTSNKVSAQGFQGSIQSSNAGGTAVNQNLFTNKNDVYLNGGPQNQNANGLPVGTYYFQVTTPNGTLLSTDPAACRQLVVALNSNGKGVISGMAAFGNGANQRPFTCNAADHLNGSFNSANGTTPVQLMPFADTSNNGGEYKVWLIRKTSNTAVASGGVIINFRNSDSKTDNFKVKAVDPPPPPQNITYTLSGCKFYDRNANGMREMDEPGIPGIKIIVTVGVVTDDPIITNASGCWERTGVAAGAEYFVEEILPLTGMEPAFYWVQTAPGTISIPDPNGQPGDFLTVRAYQGTATGGTTVNDVITISGLDFGNVCFGPGLNGKTKGWWTNKNGEAEMKGGNINPSVYPALNPLEPVPPANSAAAMNADLAFLTRLNLFGESIIKKQIVTSMFNPTNYADFKAWLSSANAYNMSYMLSAQLSATSLNVRHKHFPDSQIVDARNYCDSSGYCLGIINIGNVRFWANESLGSGGGNVTISGNSQRESQELMKNFLDGINNNWISFAQDAACPVVYPSDTTF